MEQAARASTQEDADRQATNAIINARRALDCLVDWYLERDLVSHCSSPPSSAKLKAAFLVERRIIDSLTACVLERAIATRNSIEHRYKSQTLAVAQDIVELLRRITQAIRSDSNPAHAPWFFGPFRYATGVGNRGVYAEFHGWSGPLVVVQRFCPPLWVGIVLPDSDTHATIRRADLKSFNVPQVLKMLASLEQSYGRPMSFSSFIPCSLMARAMNLEGVRTMPRANNESVGG